MNSLLALLLAGHLIGDWIIQTDYQAANKMTSWRANQEHMIGYHLALGFLSALVLDWWQVLILLAVSWITHSFIDRRWPVRWLMRLTRSETFAETTFGVIAVDQALHLSILSLMAAIYAS